MTDWADELQKNGYAFVRAPAMKAAFMQEGLSGQDPSAWNTFADSWADLGIDTYMADDGRYRRRRHAVFRVDADGATRKPDQPHYQSRDYNTLNGGIQRWFDPMHPEVAAGPAFAAIVRFAYRLFNSLTPQPAWHVEAHQFRIEAKPDQLGQPTPEGMHQDGVDWVLVLMIGRENIASGETSIHGLDRSLMGAFTLDQPMDAALVDDHRVFHGVTPVAPLNPDRPAHRDVLVLTFRRE
jgi:hypothetical protein